MEISNLKLIRLAKLYISKKDVELASKKRKERIDSIVKSLIVEKTPNESILMLREITEIFNNKMDEKLKISIEAVEVISKYKKLKR